MRHVIVPLDVVEVHGVGDAVDLIEVAQVAPQVRIVDDPTQIALEMAEIDSIEPDERDEQAPIGFERLRSEQIAPLGEPRLEQIERLEDAACRGLICRL